MLVFTQSVSRFRRNHDEASAYARRALDLNQEGWRFEVRVQWRLMPAA